MIPVEAMERCPWCRTTKPQVHDCAGDPTPCPDRRPDGSTCGECGICLAGQMSDPRYGPHPNTP